ncbi:MAG: V-type ATP synthase subunit C [Euryarchaeota archaeon]|nr:V-type ATP synthase subunit C [Euryarchaeota archaeon]
MGLKEDSKYAYSVGRIRALETKLLDRGKIDRMIEAEDAEGVLQILSETEYGDMIAEIESAEEFEKMLHVELKRTYSVARSFYPDPALVDLFMFKHDFHNLKVLLKSKLGEQQGAGELLIDLGTIADEVRELMKEDISEIVKKLPEDYARAIERTLNKFDASKDPQIIDASMDAEMFALMCEFAPQNNFLLELLRMYIDMANIKMLVRAKKLGKSKGLLSFALLENGSLLKDDLLRMYDKSSDAMIDELRRSKYGEIIAEGGEYYENLLGLEKLFDDMIMEHVKKAKYVTFGLEPLVGYIIAKENEAKLIRTILTGKLNKIPDGRIKEMVREVYV